MPANTAPISPIAPATSWQDSVLTAANTALDGTGTVGTIYTAGANGGRVGRVRVVHRGTNSNATVMRFFINNGATNATAGNNVLIAEETIAANTLSQTTKSVFYDVYLNVLLKPGYKVLYTVGTAPSSAGHAVSCVDAGDY